ncbi:MAG: amidase [Candidatus Thiodiazotropha sp. (ex Lucinoma kastoroae)]|nr:amidase [Candidatus Thiodiazotropha sp. (ex Rostrolucina anterorostrata)]MCU7850317.1 amidase [Candidatus Thiodiazotropha sp. (ex Lucinoma kastoroae)]
MGVKEPLISSNTTSLADQTALALRERLSSGALGAVELATNCLQRIATCEASIQAWTCVDEELALIQARMLDGYRQTGGPLGSLHGLPVGIKDIIDTHDLPTENGNALDSGRRPAEDAWLVARLRAAGAIIPGKTVTTECAYLAPAKTRNPHNPEHTPGGSSSGSAAAVASGMVPFAVGTQTGGSVIRPASFCGIVGFKPSFGMIPRSGVLRTSRQLDTVGTFGRTIEDAALLADVLAGHDLADPDTRPMAQPRLLETALTNPPVTPQIAFIKSPAWLDIEPDCAEGFAELVDVLGEHCDTFELPGIFDEGAKAHRCIMLTEMAHNLRHYYDRGADKLAAETCAAIEEGRTISALDYLAAIAWRDTLYAGLEAIFERYDAVITPAAPGEAPVGHSSTGSAAFNVLWSLTGVPAITLPLLTGRRGLPVGVQLIGRRNDDGRLLRTARWLTRQI